MPSRDIRHIVANGKRVYHCSTQRQRSRWRDQFTLLGKLRKKVCVGDLSRYTALAIVQSTLNKDVYLTLATWNYERRN